jgi:hypothetical protein
MFQNLFTPLGWGFQNE